MTTSIRVLFRVYVSASEQKSLWCQIESHSVDVCIWLESVHMGLMSVKSCWPAIRGIFHKPSQPCSLMGCYFLGL